MIKMHAAKQKATAQVKVSSSGCSSKSWLLFLLLLLFAMLPLYFYLHNHPYDIDSSSWKQLPQLRRPTDLRSQSQAYVHSSSPNTTTSKARILYTAPSFTTSQYVALWKSLDCLRDLCQAGYDVSVNLQVSDTAMNSTKHPLFQQLQASLYCSRIDHSVPITLEVFPEKVGFGLNSKHRQVMQRHLLEFDYFIYAEEDMQLTVSHFESYLQELRHLQATRPSDWMDFEIGFLRYEDDIGGQQRLTWEYKKDEIHLVDLPNVGQYIVTNNLNQAIYILPREQLQLLEDRCQFLSKPGNTDFYRIYRRALTKDWKYLNVGVSEWSSSFQLVLQCGLRRIIPTSHFLNFMINHAQFKGQFRKPKKDLLTMLDWMQLVEQKMKAKDFLSIEKAYGDIIYHQYNLHLLEHEKLQGKVRYFHWPDAPSK